MSCSQEADDMRCQCVSCQGGPDGVHPVLNHVRAKAAWGLHVWQDGATDTSQTDCKYVEQILYHILGSHFYLVYLVYPTIWAFWPRPSCIFAGKGFTWFSLSSKQTQKYVIYLSLKDVEDRETAIPSTIHGTRSGRRSHWSQLIALCQTRPWLR